MYLYPLLNRPNAIKYGDIFIYRYQDRQFPAGWEGLDRDYLYGVGSILGVGVGEIVRFGRESVKERE